jgi:hypothetical protein
MMLSAFWRRWVGASSVVFISPLSREECVRRLREKVGPAGLTGLFKSLKGVADTNSIIGSVGENSISLSQRINYSNSFQTYVSGDLADENDKIRLTCRIGPHPSTLVFMFVWVGFLMFFVATGFTRNDENAAVLNINMPGYHSAVQSFWVGILFPLGMACFGVGLFAVGRFFARNEEQALIDFLRETIDAEQSLGE